MKSDCFTLTCGSTGFDISFDSELFAIPNDEAPKFASGAEATFDGTNWQTSCDLGYHGMTYEIDNANNEYV